MAAMLAYQAYQNREELGRDIVGKGEHASAGDAWQKQYDLDRPTDTLDRLRQQRANRPRLAGADITPTMMTYDGTGGVGETPNWGKPSPVSTSVEVHGDMAGQTILTIKVEAPELLRIVSQAEAVIWMAGHLQLTGNGPGSTGRSSPDAAAPPPWPSGGTSAWK
jgi:hypothetical protein